MDERAYHDLHYEQDAERIQGSPLFERAHARAARQFLHFTGLGKKHRVLSLGCGDGSIERRLAPYLGEVIGIDISPVAIRQATEKAGHLPNLSFRVGASIPNNLGTFDGIAAFAFLHHLANPGIDEILIGARGALRSEGIFYSSDPSTGRLIGAFKRLVRTTYDRYHSPDERELAPRDIQARAAELGFGRVKVVSVDFFLGPLAWLAPNTHPAVAVILEAFDNLALHTPVLNRYASSFSLVARAP